MQRRGEAKYHNNEINNLFFCFVGKEKLPPIYPLNSLLWQQCIHNMESARYVNKVIKVQLSQLMVRRAFQQSQLLRQGNGQTKPVAAELN